MDALRQSIPAGVSIETSRLKGSVPRRDPAPGPGRAALNAPANKRKRAFREVLLAERLQRMMRSDQAILEFEDLRLKLDKAADGAERTRTLDRMATILKEELTRTQAARDAQLRDSRLGYEWEQDYFYTPDVLAEKLQQLRTALDREIPAYRKQHGVQ